VSLGKGKDHNLLQPKFKMSKLNIITQSKRLNTVILLYYVIDELRPHTRFFRCEPDIIKVLKGNAARWLFMETPELKQELRGSHLWNPSYFVTTISDVSEEIITNYINSQKERGDKVGSEGL